MLYQNPELSSVVRNKYITDIVDATKFSRKIIFTLGGH